ncbi:hypothetical protein DPMN_039641 [Dreissena polymorpha]|uniref:Uncharacterized protein n=1 Tax=Dreissena polymorpha TaxID=45954 RepID=A0A9D4CTL2_DREPO|nr:hypothetical protein DPMN_039641 [Dreissena polymorpha]
MDLGLFFVHYRIFVYVFQDGDDDKAGRLRTRLHQLITPQGKQLLLIRTILVNPKA